MSNPIGPDIIATDPLDPLDSKSNDGSGSRRQSSSRWFRRRLALGLSPTPIPGMVLIAGFLIGPQGIDLISTNVLSYLDPAVAAALAALGVLVGLGFDLHRPGELRLLRIASIEAAFVMILVGGGVVLTYFVLPALNVPMIFAAVTLAICAAASSTIVPSHGSPDSAATRIADLDDVVPIVVGGLALAAIRSFSIGGVAWLALQCVALTIAVAYGVWLLVAKSSSESEQRVFTIGGILLLAGIAEFLSLSALCIGLIAGVAWNILRGTARERIAAELRYIQHPLLVLLLLVAGARARSSSRVATLIVVYVALRFVGKIIGGRVSRSMLSRELPLHFGLLLISPGIIGVAFSLDVQIANMGGELLSVVVGGGIISELIARRVKPENER